MKMTEEMVRKIVKDAVAKALSIDKMAKELFKLQQSSINQVNGSQ